MKTETIKNFKTWNTQLKVELLIFNTTRCVSDINKALLAKLGWFLAKGEENLWTTMFRHKYLKDKSFFDCNIDPWKDPWILWRQGKCLTPKEWVSRVADLIDFPNRSWKQGRYNQRERKETPRGRGPLLLTLMQPGGMVLQLWRWGSESSRASQL